MPDTSTPDTGASDGGLPNAAPGTLDFGDVDCSKTGAAQTFTIQNPSNAAITWSAVLGKGAVSGFTLAPESGNLASGASVVVTATPKPVPAVSSTAANALGDIVTLSLGTTNATVTLKETARGAVLYYSPASLAFGNTPTVATPPETQFAVANSGNATASVTLATSGDPEFSIVGSATVSAVPGLTGSKVKFAPTLYQAYTGAVAMTVGATDALCAPLPTNMTLTGAGTDGVLSVTPPSVSFGSSGLVNCGTTAASQKVTITNSGNVAVTYTAVLARGTVVYTVAPASGSIPANSFVEVTVTPKAIPTSSATTADLYDDTLTVTTNAAGDSPHAIALRQTARGAVLSRPTGSINFGNVAQGTTSSLQVTFANTGNVDITLNLANALGDFVQTTPVTISAGGFAAPLVSFTPTLQQAYNDIGTLAMAPVVPLCGTLPGNLSLAGTGTVPTFSAAPSTVSFGFVPCGTTATARTVRITNRGPATTFSAILQKGGGSPFTIAPASGPMTANGFVDVTVTALPVPSTSTVTTNGINDIIEVSSPNLVGPFNIPINETAQGAIINYASKTTHAFGSLKNPATLSTPITINNTGNLTADLTFATTSSAGSVFTTSPTSATIANGTGTQSTLTFTPAVVVASTPYTGTWFASTGAILCQPLPAAITLTGTGLP